MTLLTGVEIPAILLSLLPLIDDDAHDCCAPYIAYPFASEQLEMPQALSGNLFIQMHRLLNVQVGRTALHGLKLGKSSCFRESRVHDYFRLPVKKY